MQSGDYNAVKEAVRERLTNIGAGYEDFQTLDYFEKFAVHSSNPLVREYASQMSLLTVRLLKAMRQE